MPKPMLEPLPQNLPASLQALIGQGVAAIDTPALVIDLDAMERNIQRMAAFARQRGLRWRPHAKMHKSAELALAQIAAGACGVCVQKTDEALALARAGVRNIYISNQVIAPHKLARVAALARALQAAGGRLAIAVDSLEGIERLSAAFESQSDAQCIDVLVEIDVGHGRCGAPVAQAAALAQAVASQPVLRFAGLQAYQGRAQHLRTPHERAQAIAAAADAVRSACAAIERVGLSVPLVTGAGTGTFMLEAASGLWHELQTGSFMFLDADYARNQPDPAQPPFEHALFVKTQVISLSSQHAVCDAGHKSHAIDSGMPAVRSAGAAAPLVYSSGGDEHGVLRCASAQPLPALGDTLWLIPGHCDPTVNLYDFMLGVRGGLDAGTVQRIIRVDARGALG